MDIGQRKEYLRKQGNTKTKEEFKKCCGSANDAARRNGWLSEMTWFQNGYKLRYIS